MAGPGQLCRPELDGLLLQQDADQALQLVKSALCLDKPWLQLTAIGCNSAMCCNHHTNKTSNSITNIMHHNNKNVISTTVKIMLISCFSACDELGTVRASHVSP